MTLQACNIRHILQRQHYLPAALDAAIDHSTAECRLVSNAARTADECWQWNVDRYRKTKSVAVPNSTTLAYIRSVALHDASTATARFLYGGADSRVVSHSTVVQEVPGSNPGAAEKCWVMMELFVNIYLYEFVTSACSLFRFVLIELRHWGEPSAVLWVPV